MKEEIRPYYNLALPENIAVFPMWHRSKKLTDDVEALFIANPTGFKEGTIFSYNTSVGSVFLELDSEISKEFHPGHFPHQAKDIFLFTLKCRRINWNTIKHSQQRNEIIYLNDK